MPIVMFLVVGLYVRWANRNVVVDDKKLLLTFVMGNFK